MRRPGVITVLFTLLSSLPSPRAAAEPLALPVTAKNRQLLLVRSRYWPASIGTLQRYERDRDGAWATVGDPFPVNLGRHGMAWGRGLHPDPVPGHGVIKKEGDGRSPAGVFEIPRAFGKAESLPTGTHGFPWLHTLPSTYCVEDARSEHYNQIIDEREVKQIGWERWSPLRRPDGLFDWALVVRQNDPDPRRGAGSCVFLHIWRAARVPTAGCTAMAPEHIESLVTWLEPGARPVLVQLPDAEIVARRETWGLP